MSTITGTLSPIAIDVGTECTLTIRSARLRPDGGGLVITPERIPVDVGDDGAFTTPEIAGGPCVVYVDGPGVTAALPLVVPPEGTHDLAELLLAQATYPDPVVTLVEAALADARTAAQDALDAAVDAAGRAETAAVAAGASAVAAQVRPAMWVWGGTQPWTAPAEARPIDTVLNTSTGEIHSIVEVA